MRVKFWGTRGSIPTPDPTCMRYGGDTACVEIRSGGTLLILDTGTGIRRLGHTLMSDPTFHGKGYIFLSHFHWDHIQGIPFFQPAFNPGNEFHIHGAFKVDSRLEDALRGQMGSLYFPVKMSDMPSSLHFIELLEETIQVGSCVVTSRHLNHPQGAFGYRIEDEDAVVAYATDNEPWPDRHRDEKLHELAQDADLLIFDAQFTPEDYEAHRGWGHSTWADAIEVARAANVKTVCLFHHDPYREDDAIDSILVEARRSFPDVIAASRELTLELPMESRAAPRPLPEVRPVSRAGPIQPRAIVNDESAQAWQPSSRSSGTVLFIESPPNLSLLNSKKFHEQVLANLDDGHIRVVLDMSALTYIDSAGIGSLALLFDALKKRGLELALCSVSAPILGVLDITRFTTIIKVFSDARAAEATS
ncbi:MAG: STAS domain-containing protein [Candidatus Riflebacteria bacterium]|nr:STAS domain-containing protein [Candidatus Riflebacteria bacterium]